jgi:HSP20 family protein
MSTLTRRNNHATAVGLIDWLELPLTLVWPVARHFMRVEDYVKDGRYVLRAELPGIDPENDVEVTVAGGVLTIKADRLDATEGTHRSEFRYGAFTRRVPLPADADEKHIQASYDSGILEVVVPLKGADDSQRRIPVRLNKHIKLT